MFGISKLETTIHLLLNKFRKEEELEEVDELLNSCFEILDKVKIELLSELKALKNE